MGYLAIEWLGRRDWRAGAILGCIAAGWLPWVIFYNERTVFGFYTVVLSAFMALAVAYCLGRILGSADASPRRRTTGAGSAALARSDKNHVSPAKNFLDLFKMVLGRSFTNLGVCASA